MRIKDWKQTPHFPKKKKKNAPLSAQSNAIRMTDHTETPHVSTSSRLLYLLNLNKRYLCYSLQYVSILTPSLQLHSARAYQCDAVLSKMCAVWYRLSCPGESKHHEPWQEMEKRADQARGGWFNPFITVECSSWIEQNSPLFLQGIEDHTQQQPILPVQSSFSFNAFSVS